MYSCKLSIIHGEITTIDINTSILCISGFDINISSIYIGVLLLTGLPVRSPLQSFISFAGSIRI